MKRFAIVLCLLLGAISPTEGKLRVQLNGVQDSLFIGDPLTVTLSISAPADGQVILPDWNEELDPFELTVPPDTSAFDTTGDNHRLTLTLRTTCYQGGEQVFQPLSVRWVAADGSRLDSVATEPHIVFVQGVVPDSILALADTTGQKYHLLQPNRRFTLGYSLADFIPWILIIGGAVILFFAVRWWRKRRKREEAAVSGPPPRPAYEIAFEALDQLRDRQLYQSGKIKEYYSELSDILRHYIEARFGVSAMESTSFQLLRTMEHQIDDRNLHTLMEAILTDADLAKFAKHRPEADSCQKDLQNAYIFVTKTKPAPPPILSEEAA